jgi:glutamate-1-semialdehyde aminotransferase
MVPGRPEFLRALREVTAACGVLLIFDEVISFPGSAPAVSRG